MTFLTYKNAPIKLFNIGRTVERMLCAHERTIRDDLELINIGRIVEREFPQVQFNTLEDLRVFLNDNIGTNIQNGERISDVRKAIEKALVTIAYDRSIRVI